MVAEVEGRQTGRNIALVVSSPWDCSKCFTLQNCHKCSLTNLLREATILIVSTHAYCSVENT